MIFGESFSAWQYVSDHVGGTTQAVM